MIQPELYRLIVPTVTFIASTQFRIDFKMFLITFEAQVVLKLHGRAFVSWSTLVIATQKVWITITITRHNPPFVTRNTHFWNEMKWSGSFRCWWLLCVIVELTSSLNSFFCRHAFVEQPINLNFMVCILF